MWKISSLNYIPIAVVLSIMSQGLEAGRPLTVCEALDHVSELQGEVVRVRGLLAGSKRHGYSLDQSTNAAPCPGWRRSFLTSPPSILLSWSPAVSVEGLRDQLGEDVFKRAQARYERHDFHAQEVEVVGRIFRKSLALVFRRSDGSYFGNGYGQQGMFLARLEIQEIREVPIR